MVLDLTSVLGSRASGTSTSWRPVDTVLVTVFMAIAGWLRYAGITQPASFSFDEHYAADACLYLFGSDSRCVFTSETGLAHPPLGKWLIALGIQLYGFTSAGWRLAPLVAGTLSVGVLYLLARRLLASTLAASVAAGLLAFDFLHFVMSRTAMLDIFVVLFGLLSFLCFVYDRERVESTPFTARNVGVWRLFERRWLIAAGLAGGAAVATKWSGGYLLGAVAVLAVIDAAARRRESANRYLRVVREEGVLLLMSLVLLPAMVYVLSYAGRFAGPVMAWPWSDGSWIHAFVARQQEMFEHHRGSLYVHPYMSPAWSWPLIQRPVLFYFREFADGRYQEILAVGNPLVWWPAFAALAVMAWRVIRRRLDARRELIVLAGFSAGYLPWLIITRRESFLYYFLPAVPFLYLALADTVARVASKFNRAIVLTGLTAVAISAFAFFWPLLAARPLTYESWERRILLQDCGAAATGARKKPILEPRPSPAGWCWL